MRLKKNAVRFCALLIFAIVYFRYSAMAQYTFTTISDPMADVGRGGTTAYGTDKGNIVGIYFDSSHKINSFLYSNGAFSALNNPPGGIAYGISGDSVVGQFSPAGGPYFGEGYIYNTTSGTYTPFSDPLGVAGTLPNGVQGTNAYGAYVDAGYVYHGFIYNENSQTFTTVDNPLAGGLPPDTGSTGFGTSVSGISDNYIVGSFSDSNYYEHGYVYNIATGAYTTLDDPLAYLGSSLHGTLVTGLRGRMSLDTIRTQAKRIIVSFLIWKMTPSHQLTICWRWKIHTQAL